MIYALHPREAPPVPTLSDAAYAAAGVAVTGFFGMIGNYFMSRQRRAEQRDKVEATLTDVVDRRIKMILDEGEHQASNREAYIAKLEGEVQKLRATVDTLVRIVRNTLVRGTGCSALGEGECPIKPGELTEMLTQVLTMHITEAGAEIPPVSQSQHA